MAGGFRGDVGGETGMRGETPGPVDDHPHRQADVAVKHRRLHFTVAQLHDLGGDGMHAQVGVARPAGPCRRERGVGQLAQGQSEELVVDVPRTHRSTVAGYDAGYADDRPDGRPG